MANFCIEVLVKLSSVLTELKTISPATGKIILWELKSTKNYFKRSDVSLPLAVFSLKTFQLHHLKDT